MARILIVGGGSRGLRLGESLLEEGQAVRITTRELSRRAEIQGIGAEYMHGDPHRLATLMGALDGITVACWLLAAADGRDDQIRALHGSRLEFFLGQAIDTPLRGFLYEASPGRLPAEVLAGGAASARRIASLNAIPCEILEAPLEDHTRWLAEALAGIEAIMNGRAW